MKYASRAARILLASTLAFSAGSAHALFGDDEARRAILDLRARVQQLQDESIQRQTQLHDALARLEQSSRVQFETQSQVEQLRQEVAKLRGQLEVQGNDLGMLQRQLSSHGTTSDGRKRYDPVGVEIDGRSVTVDQEEKRAFEAALGQFRAGDYKNALTSFRQFESLYPQSPYAPATYFWIGSSQFALKDYKGAIASHENLVSKFPDNSRVPDAILNIGYAQAEAGDRNTARKTLQSLTQRFPQSPAAQLARDRLASMPAGNNNR